jgi:hypothetical protein
MFLRSASLTLIAVVIFTVPAWPQSTGTSAPAGAVFRGADHRRVDHGLDLTFSVVEGYDSDTPVHSGVSDSVISGASTMLIGNMRYQWRGSRVQVGASSESVVRNYKRFEGANGVSYSAGAGLSVRLDGRTTLFVNQTAAYSPAYLFLLFPGGNVKEPGDASPAAPDYTITHTDSYLYGTTLTVSRHLTNRSGLSATGEMQHTLFPNDRTHDQNYRSIRGEYSRSISKRTSLHAGYRYRIGRFWQIASQAPDEPQISATEHALNVGADWSRPLSATRTVTLGLTIGSSATTTPALATTDARAGRFVRLVTAASGTYQFSPNWTAGGTYERGLEFVATLHQPVFANGFNAELNGLIHPRLEVTTSTRYSSGASALYRSAPAYDTYGTEFRLRYALARSWAIYAQYFYYFYDFPQAPLGDLPPDFKRNGIRVGLTLWAPVLRR